MYLEPNITGYQLENSGNFDGAWHWKDRKIKLSTENRLPQINKFKITLKVAITCTDLRMSTQIHWIFVRVNPVKPATYVQLLISSGSSHSLAARLSSQLLLLRSISSLSLYSQSGRASYRKISLSLGAAKLDVVIMVSFWNLTGISAALLPRCLSNFRAIGKV